MKGSHLLTTALAAGTLCAISFAAPTGAMADNIVLNQWYTGHFTATPSPLLAGAFTPGTHGPIKPWPNFGNATAAPGVFGTPGTWTITLAHGPGRLTVTDVETSGDSFTMFDNGAPMIGAAPQFGPLPQNGGALSPGGGDTSVPCINCSFGVEDINLALAPPYLYSSATFWLYPGST